jgi:hypothetical protein
VVRTVMFVVAYEGRKKGKRGLSDDRVESGCEECAVGTLGDGGKDSRVESTRGGQEQRAGRGSGDGAERAWREPGEEASHFR